MHVTVTVDPATRKEVEVFAQLGKAGDVCSSDLEAICRMVSMYLRLGGSILDVIKQFEGIGSHLSVATKDGAVKSLADGLAKSMKIYHLAKTQHGLDDILLGRVDISKISLKGEGSLKATESKATEETTVASRSESNQAAYKVKCPECGGVLSFQEGCVKCSSCGYSKCS
jgi:ribonucleoside-diphosphate reductase alpha chain